MRRFGATLVAGFWKLFFFLAGPIRRWWERKEREEFEEWKKEITKLADRKVNRRFLYHDRM